MEDDNRDNENGQNVPNGPPRYSDIEKVNYIAALNIRDTLGLSAEGQAILAVYDASDSNELPDPLKNRRVVMRLIADAVMAVKPEITTSEIESVADKITKFFANELVKTYFDKINQKYHGILYQYCKNKKRQLKIIRQSTDLEAEEERIDPDVEASKAFLDANVEPWDDVKAAWKKTNKMRQKDLLSVNEPRKKKKKNDNNDNNIPAVKIGQFFDKWSSLKTPNGHELVESDFTDWYPDAEEMTSEKMDDLLRVLFERLETGKKNQKAVRWITEIRELQEKIESADTDENEKAATQIKLFAFLLPPTGRGSPSDKMSVIDVVDSILIFAEPGDDAVQAALSKKQTELLKKKKKLQPIIVIVGNFEEILCCVYNVKWKVNNVLSAFDILFKSFFTLDLDFPYQSIVHYEVIQDYIYKIESKPIHPKARTVVSDLRRLNN